MHIIILAGGLGSRLSSVSQNLPKVMVPVAGRPFLTHILDRLPADALITLCVGYKKEYVSDFFGSAYQGREIRYSCEESPLGTGGAVLQAIRGLNEENVCLINGDTVFDLNVNDLMDKHLAYNADVSIALKSMSGFDRYGTVSIDSGNRVTGFEEKKYTKQGLINGGVYMLKLQSLRSLVLPEVFSLEKDLFEKNVRQLDMRGIVYDSLFIDIGVPEDLARAGGILT